MGKIQFPYKVFTSIALASQEKLINVATFTKHNGCTKCGYTPNIVNKIVKLHSFITIYI